MTGELRALVVAVALHGAAWSSAAAQAPTQTTKPRVMELAGSRDRPGLFTERLILPPNFCGPVHLHDRDLHGLVLRGVLRMAVADSAGTLQVREYPAGSFVAVPAGRRHLEGSGPETEIHVSGIGPVRTVVDSSAARPCTPDRAARTERAMTSA
jgi:quercetin dioxygenase-like cupin family protein